MTEPAVSVCLREAVDEVLETMFFVESEGPASRSGPPEEMVASQVDFKGSPSGSLSLRITLPAARSLAADFLGEDVSDLAARRAAEVVSELANMICGAVLSRVESDTTFRLSAPLTTFETGPVVQVLPGAVACHLAIPGGTLTVSFLCQGDGA
jgi:CheY-specific phosphatase CheX